MNQEQFQKIVLEKFDTLDAKFDNLEGRFDNLENKFDTFENKFDTFEKQIDTIAIKVVEIDHELQQKPSREEMNEKFDHHMESTDRFIKLHETLDQETTMTRHAQTRLEQRVERLEQHTNIT